MFRVAADRRDVLALVWVVHVREARVVELEVGAAEVAEPAHLFGIRVRQVAPEQVELRVDLGIDRSPAGAVMNHAR